MALTEMQNGDIVAGGYFSQPGLNVARYTGTQWIPLGNGLATGGSDSVTGLTVLPSGDLVAVGSIHGSGTTFIDSIARWDGFAWSQLDPGGSHGLAMKSVVKQPNGTLLAGGGGNAISQAYSVGTWNGTAWTTIGPMSYASGEVYCLLELPSGEIFAGGYFSQFAGEPMANVRKWDGAAWRPLVEGTNGAVFDSVEMPNGNLVVGGFFNRIEGFPINSIAEWDGHSWHDMGGGVPGLNQEVSKLAVRNDGSLIVAGQFTSIGGIAAATVARWDGASWDAMNSPFDPTWSASIIPLCLLAHSSGDVYVAGRMRVVGGGAPYAVFRWDGTTWSGLGMSVNHWVYALAEMPNGDLIAGGSFASVGGVTLNNIGRWDGSNWHPIGAGVSGQVSALAVMPNGDIVAGGVFTTNGGTAVFNIARWDGTAWHGTATTGAPLYVRDITVLPNGEWIVAGRFQPSATNFLEYGVKRWDGSSWHWVAWVFDASGAPLAHSVTRLRNGSIQIAGDFDSFNFVGASGGLLEWRPLCPAVAVDLGGGCPGAVLPLTLAAEQLPWVGSSYRGSATGFGVSALAASVIGLSSPGSSLQLLTPFAAPACLQMASPDSIALALVQSGVATASVAVPNSSAYVGLNLFHQFVQLENGGSSPRISASNGLRLRIGTY